MLRFVDDYFAVESAASAEHAMQIFARCIVLCFRFEHVACACSRCRLVRAILGEDAISKRKLEYGNPMTVLGIKIEANLVGVVFTPDEEKVRVNCSCDIAYFKNKIVRAFAGCKLDEGPRGGVAPEHAGGR